MRVLACEKFETAWGMLKLIEHVYVLYSLVQGGFEAKGLETLLFAGIKVTAWNPRRSSWPQKGMTLELGMVLDLLDGNA